jgi:DNA-binding transcriptional ArsR family regulator
MPNEAVAAMRMNEAFKALADPTRREILRLLRRGEMTAGELAERFDMAKPSVSHHFNVLKQADLITSRRDGQQIFYALNTTVVEDLLAIIWDLFPNHRPAQEESET